MLLTRTVNVKRSCQRVDIGRVKTVKLCKRIRYWLLSTAFKSHDARFVVVFGRGCLHRYKMKGSETRSVFFFVTRDGVYVPRPMQATEDPRSCMSAPLSDRAMLWKTERDTDAAQLPMVVI